MPRHHQNWLKAFMDYAQFGEAPKRMYFWTGVTTLAGALNRKVWIDQKYFRWYPNFYVCLVAPPGVVSKSTTASIGMNLLRRVPGITFGPDVVTWQALVTSFRDAQVAVEMEKDVYVDMSPMTLESSEFGNLLNPQDKEMVDLLVSLWDGKSLQKKTKFNGIDDVVNPYINLIACTTPSWIAGNFPEYMIGGGFTSRCIFVYADKKEKYVAYPSLHVPAHMEQQATELVEDLIEISKLKGEFRLTGDALRWGEIWYQEHYTKSQGHLDSDQFGGYIARKQTHLHKLAMVLSAAEGDSLAITADHLALSDEMITDLEADMVHVFSKIGKTEHSLHADRFINYIRQRGGCPLGEAYRAVHRYFPSARAFDEMVLGCVTAGYIRKQTQSGVLYVYPCWEPPKKEK